MILGWDKGVATMKKGEKAVLECSPEYGYGDMGAGGVIPPKATLLFEVEVRSICLSRSCGGATGLLLCCVCFSGDFSLVFVYH